MCVCRRLWCVVLLAVCGCSEPEPEPTLSLGALRESSFWAPLAEDAPGHFATNGPLVTEKDGALVAREWVNLAMMREEEVFDLYLSPLKVGTCSVSRVRTVEVESVVGSGVRASALEDGRLRLRVRKTGASSVVARVGRLSLAPSCSGNIHDHVTGAYTLHVDITAKHPTWALHAHNASRFDEEVGCSSRIVRSGEVIPLYATSWSNLSQPALRLFAEGVTLTPHESGRLDAVRVEGEGTVRVVFPDDREEVIRVVPREAVTSFDVAYWFNGTKGYGGRVEDGEEYGAEHFRPSIWWTTELVPFVRREYVGAECVNSRRMYPSDYRVVLETPEVCGAWPRAGRFPYDHVCGAQAREPDDPEYRSPEECAMQRWYWEHDTLHADVLRDGVCALRLEAPTYGRGAGISSPTFSIRLRDTEKLYRPE